MAGRSREAQLSCVKVLVEARADVAARDSMGRNLLHLADETGSAAVISFLGGKICGGGGGVDAGGAGAGAAAAAAAGAGAGGGGMIDAYDDTGMTPLLRAAFMCRALISLKADLEAKATVLRSCSFPLFHVCDFFVGSTR